MHLHSYLSLLFIVSSCFLKTQDPDTAIQGTAISKNQFQTIASIPVPAGFERLPVAKGSFGEWLRNVGLKKDARVFLYNGLLKANQSVQFAVLDMPVGNKDLQQCADAIIRLRAEYFFARQQFDSIYFRATDGTVISFGKWRKGTRYRLAGDKLKTFFAASRIPDRRTDFEKYLETVYSYAGTCSLSGELQEVPDINNLMPGDVFIKPGFPGHAMIVMDVAINRKGKKIFMLAQGYMPAQDIHLVKNYEDAIKSPWYQMPAGRELVTPEWTFTIQQIKRWQ